MTETRHTTPDAPRRSPVIDLDAYVARIGLDHRPTPDLDSLRAIIRHHTASIAFENVDQFCRIPCPLDPPSLEAKLVHGRRGGWCYEHNLLLMNALDQIGFDVTGLAARVTWMRTDDLPVPARTHMLIRVDLDGRRYVVDVGFGGLTVTAPVALEPDVIQPTPHEPVRLVAVGGDYELEAELRGAWTPLYRFSLDEHVLADYEIASWYLSTNPESRFLTNLIAARPDHDRRYALLDTTLTTHPLNSRSPERHTVATVEELLDVLRGTFLLDIPDSEAITSGLQRLFERGQ